MSKKNNPCRWVTISEALETFALARKGVHGQDHIRPLHWYISSRLCLEGGFDPDEITPRPPFEVKSLKVSGYARKQLKHRPELGGSGEQVILGGLKTKKVDVVVTKPNIGPVVAVSVKGTLNAFRNLTNRMEEAGGDCTNLHMTYPSLVYAFWSVIRANRPGPWNERMPFSSADGEVASNDISINSDGTPVASIQRYHLALSGLTGRSGIRDDVSGYEAICLTIADVDEPAEHHVHSAFPPAADPLNLSRFFSTIYRAYDIRFVYQAPDLKAQTERNVWYIKSDFFGGEKLLEYEPRYSE